MHTCHPKSNSVKTSKMHALKQSLPKLSLLRFYLFRRAEVCLNFPVLKSLVYFDDADSQPMPRMHEEVSWEKVKEDMIKVAKEFQV